MTWRCPHCSTPQPEASRCWVCHRSSTSCGTCRHFRQSVAARVGFCALDRRHRPLDGDEVRACWEDGAQPIVAEPPIPGMLGLMAAPDESDGSTERVGPPRSTPSAGIHPQASRSRSDGSTLDWVELEV